jgi:hypothetical protein
LGTFNSLGKDIVEGVAVKNHDRVSRIFKGLNRLGLKCWFDEVEMENLIIDQMCQGIDDSAVFVVFLTDRYIEKVRSPNEQDNCKKEFNYAEKRKGGQCMIPVVMDPDAGSSWAGPVGMILGQKLYIDFSDDAIWQSVNEVQFEEKLMELHKRIESIISGLDADVSASQSEPEPEPSSPYVAATVAGPISSDVSIVSQEKMTEQPRTLKGVSESGKPYTYTGSIINGKAHGKGRRAYDDGCVYEGDFEDNKMHGTGTYTWLDGQEYIGDWKDGLKEGTGTYTWPSGKKYIGEYKNDKKEGTGTQT